MRVRLTRVGAVIITILVVCAVAVLVGGRSARLVGLVVGCLILLVLAGEGVGSGYWGDAARKREVLRREGRRARARRPATPDEEAPSADSGLLPRRRRDPD
jgi:hypothetical protein